MFHTADFILHISYFISKEHNVMPPEAASKDQDWGRGGGKSEGERGRGGQKREERGRRRKGEEKERGGERKTRRNSSKSIYKLT